MRRFANFLVLLVVAIQHQLKTDSDEPKFWKERSISRYGKVIDSMLYVFERAPNILALWTTAIL